MTQIMLMRRRAIEMTMLERIECWLTRATNKTLRRRLCHLMHHIEQDLARLRDELG